MKNPEDSVLQPLVVGLLKHRAGSGPDATSVAKVAGHAYDDLATALVPLIGQVGTDALTTRALHLAQKRHEWGELGKDQGAGAFGQVSSWLALQEPALASDAAAAILSTLGGLLVTLIGEPLTMRLLRKAWPDGFLDPTSLETTT